MKIILLILISFNIFVNAEDINRFKRNHGVVNDSATNLEWQDSYNDNNNIKRTTWNSAINYCESLNLNEKSDWRLPNINELTSLLDYTKDVPAIYSIFENTSYLSKYWTSTSYSEENDYAWIISFRRGSQYGKGYKYYDYNTRCVRGGI